MGFWDSVKKFLARLLAVIAIIVLIIVLIACLCTGNYAGAVGVAGGLMGMLAWVATNWVLIVALCIIAGACAMLCDEEAASAVFSAFGQALGQVAASLMEVVTEVATAVLTSSGLFPWLVGGVAAFMLLRKPGNAPTINMQPARG